MLWGQITSRGTTRPLESGIPALPLTDWVLTDKQLSSLSLSFCTLSVEGMNTACIRGCGKM